MDCPIAPLLNQPVGGSWLARSAVQLSHALIETGRWGSALACLRLIDGWVSRLDSELDRKQLAYQHAGQHWTIGPDDSWKHGGTIPADAERVSLRSADLWVEAQQYLALVQRDDATEISVERLAHTHKALSMRTPERRFSPESIARYRGVIGHDLASLKLRRGYPPAMVLRDLDEAEATLRAAGNTSMLAPIMLARASAFGRLMNTEPSGRRLLSAVEQSIGDAMRQAEAGPVLSIQVRVAIESIELLISLRGPEPEDVDQLAAAAAHAIERRFAVQARKILQSEHLLALVTDLESDLRAVSQAS